MIQLTELFATTNHGHQNGSSVFYARQTADGRWVCHPNALITFPELFEGTNFPTMDVDPSDFAEQGIQH